MADTNYEPIDSVADMLTTEQAAARLGVKTITMEMWRVKRIGPDFHKIGKRVWYSTEDIAAYIRSRRQKVA